MPSHAMLRKIWGGAREVGLDEEQLRDLVMSISGERSISRLSYRRAHEVIDALVRLGARPGAIEPAPSRKPSGRRTPAGVTLMITPDQRQLIADLREQLGGDWLRDRYFEGACIKVIRRSSPSTAGQAARVIEMLKRRGEYNRARKP